MLYIYDYVNYNAHPIKRQNFQLLFDVVNGVGLSGKYNFNSLTQQLIILIACAFWFAKNLFCNKVQVFFLVNVSKLLFPYLLLHIFACFNFVTLAFLAGSCSILLLFTRKICISLIKIVCKILTKTIFKRLNNI